MKSSYIKAVLGGLGVLAVLIQFMPVDRSNPPITQEVRWDSEATRDVARRACYDCHSNETTWPWYSSVAPASWLVARDVAEGREHLNFSTWDQPNEDAEKIIEMVEDGEMPLRKYTLLHPEARLDEEARALLVRGLRATLDGDPPVAHDDDEHGEDEEDEHDDDDHQ